MRILKIDKLHRRIEKDTLESTEVKKTLFVLLLIGSCVLSLFVLFILWYVPFVGLKNLGSYVPWLWGSIISVFSLFILWSCMGLIVNIYFEKNLLFPAKIRGITIKLFFPLMLFIGKLVSIPQSKIRASFIKVNNELVTRKNQKFPPHKVLILIPHCLQSSKCTIRITYNIENCKRCGMCPISYILKLKDKFKVEAAIATGGTIARRIVVQKKPSFIIAIACERDLASGIQDTYPLPVFGVINKRPHGPCIDTEVSLELLENTIKHFTTKQ